MAVLFISSRTLKIWNRNLNAKGFTWFGKFLSNESPSEEFEASNDSSSSSDFGRIDRVRNEDLDEEDDTDYQNIFYSSEDLILKFIELDEQNHDDVKMIKDGEAQTYSDEGGNKITNTNSI